MKTSAVPFFAVATFVYSISVSSAEQTFRVNNVATGSTIEYVSNADSASQICLQSVDYVENSKEKKDMVLSDLTLERQEYSGEVSQKSFDIAENYIKSLSVPFLVTPQAFVRPSGHPAFYWGLGKSRHITLSIVDDDLLLSIILPDQDTRIVMPSTVNNFNALAQTINDYLG